MAAIFKELHNGWLTTRKVDSFTGQVLSELSQKPIDPVIQARMPTLKAKEHNPPTLLEYLVFGLKI